MNLTLSVKLVPTAEQHAALLATMERFNAACNDIAVVAFREHSANKVRLQKLVYTDIRERFGLSAQLTIRAIAKVCEAYKRDKSVQPTFRPHGAVVYDERILTWKALDRVSILSLSGRLVIPVVIGAYQRLRWGRVRGQADLLYRDGTFYLQVVVDVTEPPLVEGSDVLGVDLGIVNLAADSDGETYSGATVDVKRRHYEKLRSSLQRVGTKNSRRRLQRIRHRERRFKRDVNHVIAKHLVAKAHDTGRDLALEDLSGIRERTTVKRAQRSRHAKWAFAELRTFVTYKAVLAGVYVHLVDPRNTSRQCAVCGHIAPANRPSQAVFKCVSCGHADLADHNAAQNIRARAAANRLMASDALLGAVPGASPRLSVVGS